MLFDCQCLDRTGEAIITGTAEVIALAEKIVRSRVNLPGFEQHRHEVFEELIARGHGLDPCPTAIAHPCDENSLANADGAALVLGARVPIILTSRGYPAGQTRLLRGGQAGRS